MMSIKKTGVSLAHEGFRTTIVIIMVRQIEQKCKKMHVVPRKNVTSCLFTITFTMKAASNAHEKYRYSIQCLPITLGMTAADHVYSRIFFTDRYLQFNIKLIYLQEAHLERKRCNLFILIHFYSTPFLSILFSNQTEAP